VLSLKKNFFSSICLLSASLLSNAECAQKQSSSPSNVVEIPSPENLNIQNFDIDPVAQYKKWLQNAVDQKIRFPYVFILSTNSAQNRPTSRVMRVSRIENQGIVFYANVGSKAQSDLPDNTRISGLVNWYNPNTKTFRQIQIHGTVKKLRALDKRIYLYEKKNYEVDENEFLFVWDAATFSSTAVTENLFDGAVQSIHYMKSEKGWEKTKNPVYFY